MLKYYGKHLNIVFRLAEVSLILLAFFAAYYLRYGKPAFNVFGMPVQYQALLAGELVLWIYVSERFMLYGSKRMVGLSDEMLDVFFTITVCLLISSIPPYFVREAPLSRIFLVKFWLLQTSSLMLFRLGLRSGLKFIRMRGYNYRQILIVGQNGRVDDLVRRIEETPELGFRILGYVDAGSAKSRGCSISGYEFLGGLDNLEKILREKVVDEVFVLLPIKSFYGEIERILGLCENVGVEVKISTDLFIHRLAKSTISTYCDMTVISMYSSPRMNWQLVVKRLVDLAVSASLLIILSPMLLTVAALIKATSDGPVIFRQKRKGYNGRTFDCLKFRTMVAGAEGLKKDLLKLNEMDGPVFKIKNDPRITRLGRVLRKTSMDEFPQLINVLKGDMSLVGPRPPLPDEVSEYDLPYLRRLSMKPGLTCLWQVCGRNSVPFEKWMELDKQYIDHWSLWLDFKIMLKTIPVVIKGSGA